MPLKIVDNGPAVQIVRQKGITVTLINQGAVDVYVDDEPMRLNSSSTLTIANGTKIAANGGELQISYFKGRIWARANSATTLEVQP